MPDHHQLTKLEMEARARLLFLLIHHQSWSSERSKTTIGKVRPPAENRGRVDGRLYHDGPELLRLGARTQSISATCSRQLSG